MYIYMCRALKPREMHTYYVYINIILRIDYICVYMCRALKPRGTLKVKRPGVPLPARLCHNPTLRFLSYRTMDRADPIDYRL